MNQLDKRFFFVIAIFFGTFINVTSHPSSSMIYSSGNLYWVYISPIKDVNHKAVIMKWNENDGVSTFYVSKHSASDLTLSISSDGFYVLESYYTNNEYFTRLLKKTEEGNLIEAIPWFTTSERLDQHGIYVDSNEQIIFCDFPKISVRKSDGSITEWKEFDFDIHSLSAEGNNQFLLRGETKALLIDSDGNKLQEWNNLLENPISDLPFRGNIIYDIDYGNGQLLIAYWGKRKFDLIKDGNRTTLKELFHPYIPHSALINGDEYFLLASTIAPGEFNEINPVLWRIHNGKTELIWGTYKKVIHKRRVVN